MGFEWTFFSIYFDPAVLQQQQQQRARHMTKQSDNNVDAVAEWKSCWKWFHSRMTFSPNNVVVSSLRRTFALDKACLNFHNWGRKKGCITENLKWIFTTIDEGSSDYEIFPRVLIIAALRRARLLLYFSSPTQSPWNWDRLQAARDTHNSHISWLWRCVCLSAVDNHNFSMLKMECCIQHWKSCEKFHFNSDQGWKIHRW